jgi:hypothetical protein
MPGFFGFLVWELKENWRLFEATRPARLKAQILGSHGETAIRLLNPGFHSGTLPKAFARLRKASGDSSSRSKQRAMAKELHRIHHVEELVQRFTERVLLAPLFESRAWPEGALSVRDVEASGHRLRICLEVTSCPDQALEIHLENQSGWLVGSLAKFPQSESIPTEQRGSFQQAVAGFYCQLGVDLVREQIRSLLKSDSAPYDVADVGLLLWPGEDYGRQVEYIFDRRTLLVPMEGKEACASLPPIPRKRMFLRENPIPYALWASYWNDYGPQKQGLRLLPSFHILSESQEKRPER